MANVKSSLPMPLLFLLGGVALMHMADYLIIPLLPVILRTERGLSAGQVGLVLSLSSFLFLFGSLLGGTLSDWAGRRTIMCGGAVLRAVGVLGYAYMQGIMLLGLSAAIAGLGTGLFAPALKAAIAALASGDHRTTAFSWRGVAANVGVGVAGLLALLLGVFGTPFMFTVAASVHVTLGVSTLFVVKQDQKSDVGGGTLPALQLGAFGQAFGNRAFLAVSAVSFLMWALFAQLALALPLHAASVLSQTKTVGLIWTINSALVIALQHVMTRTIIQRVHPLTAMAIGTALLGIGLAAIAPARSFIGLAGAATIFVLGEMLILPTYDVLISRLAPPDRVGAYFGLSNFVSGTGESFGNLLGGQLLQFGTGSPFVPVAYGGLAAVVTTAMTYVRRRPSLRGAFRGRTASNWPELPKPKGPKLLE